MLFPLEQHGRKIPINDLKTDLITYRLYVRNKMFSGSLESNFVFICYSISFIYLMYFLLYLIYFKSKHAYKFYLATV